MSFVKRRPHAPAGFFEVEAAGLAWLAAADAVRTVGVLDVGPDFIELERLSPAPLTRSDAARFGRGLAALHDAGAPAFGAPPAGWDGDGYIGDAPLPLRPDATWGRFYARHRIEPYLADAGLDRPTLDALRALCDRLERGDFDDDAPPARIHGDLWAGNLMGTPHGATLIDPAAHGGHRITDLAMLCLFGAPHLDAILAAYAEASTCLPPRWRELIPLHQIHPLLVHAVLFGGGYRGQVSDAVAAALSSPANHASI